MLLSQQPPSGSFIGFGSRREHILHLELLGKTQRNVFTAEDLAVVGLTVSA